MILSLVFLFSAYIGVGGDVGTIVAIVLPEIGVNYSLCLWDGETIMLEINRLLVILWEVLGQSTVLNGLYQNLPALQVEQMFLLQDELP